MIKAKAGTPFKSVTRFSLAGGFGSGLDPSFGDMTDRLVAEARHIELGGDKDFSSAFIEAMMF